MSARLTLLGLCAAALALAPAAALGSGGSHSKTYKDTLHEDGQAPDITSVVVSNDEARNLRFRINIANRPAFTSDMTVLTFVDADGKRTTGDRGTYGADYVIELDKGSVALFKWTGSDYTYASDQSTLSYSYDRHGATIRINAADLGSTTAFKFGVLAISGLTTGADGSPDASNAHRDYLPNAGRGFASFAVVAKVALKETAFSVSPAPARSGGRLTASLAAEENDTNAPAAGGTVSCTGTVRGKPVRATHTLAFGVASCNWAIPGSARGATFRGTLTLDVKGARIVKRFATRIR